jgi:hypothetical protein
LAKSGRYWYGVKFSLKVIGKPRWWWVLVA